MKIGEISIGGEDYGRMFGLRIVVLEQSIFLGCNHTHWLHLQLAWSWPSFRPLAIERGARSWSWIEA